MLKFMVIIQNKDFSLIKLKILAYGQTHHIKTLFINNIFSGNLPLPR